LFASLARLLSPVFDVLIRLWLAAGFLVTDVSQHMLPGGQAIVLDHPSPSASLLAGLAHKNALFGSGGTDAHVRDDGRHCPMHVHAAPEVRSMAAQRLANG
jgi:hypothetical protein